MRSCFFFKYFGKPERKCVKMPRNDGDSLMLIPQIQCFSDNYIWFINVVFRDEHVSNPFSILTAMLSATFLQLECFLNNLEITLPWSEFPLRLQIRWKLKPEDVSKLNHTMEGKIFAKTVILVRLLFCFFWFFTWRGQFLGTHLHG